MSHHLDACMDLHGEGNCNFRNRSAKATDDNSESMDTALAALNPKKEVNVTASPLVKRVRRINHALVDTYQHNSLAWQQTHIQTITSNETDDHCDIETHDFVQILAKGCLAPPPEPLEQDENMSPKHRP